MMVEFAGKSNSAVKLNVNFLTCIERPIDNTAYSSCVVFYGARGV